MYEKISRTNKILSRRRVEEKITPMNTADDIAKIDSMNKYMEEVRREYRTKESQSQISASKVILNS